MASWLAYLIWKRSLDYKNVIFGNQNYKYVAFILCEKSIKALKIKENSRLDENFSRGIRLAEYYTFS